MYLHSMAAKTVTVYAHAVCALTCTCLHCILHLVLHELLHRRVGLRWRVAIDLRHTVTQLWSCKCIAIQRGTPR